MKNIMRPQKTSLSITLDADIVKKMRCEAEKCERSVSQLINIILKDFLQSKKNIQSYYLPSNRE